MSAIAEPTKEQVERWREKHGIKQTDDGWFEEMPAGAPPLGAEKLLENVAANALRHDIPNLRQCLYTSRIAVFVGGGPSAGELLEEIREKAAQPDRYDVYCSNATAAWLLSHGIVPKYQVVIDPKPSKAADVAHRDDRITYLIGLQCDSSVFETLQGLRAFKFLASSATGEDGTRDIDVARVACTRTDPTITSIGGGTMMGTRMMPLADVLGHRRLEYYGFDGDIRIDEKGEIGYYAYAKERGEAITEVECEDGRKFLSTLTFSRQAHELVDFRAQMPWLDIVIHGDGFLAHTLELDRAKDPIELAERITAEYAALQREMAPRYEGAGRAYAPRVYLLAAQVMKHKGAISLLDYGCGQRALEKAITGSFAQFRDALVFEGYDPGIPELAAGPAPADIVTCTDVMEHVEEPCVAAVLAHIARLTRKAAFFAIDLAAADKTLPDGRNAHITIRSALWWQGQLKRHFIVIEAATQGEVAIFVCQPFPKETGHGSR